jgi:hypothetical protein
MNAQRKQILSELSRIWTKCPHWRFGQLTLSARPILRSNCAIEDFFTATDDAYLEAIQAIVPGEIASTDESIAHLVSMIMHEYMDAHLAERAAMRIIQQHSTILSEAARVWDLFPDLHFPQLVRCAAIGAGVRGDNFYQMEDTDAIRGFGACRGA